MHNGLYNATSGLLMQEQRMNSIAQNLANINTSGYKKEVPVFTLHQPQPGEHPNEYIRSTDYNKAMNSTVLIADKKNDFSIGYLKGTGRKLDLALEKPNAFFAIDTPFGIRFTRAGHFTVNENNELVTQEGYKVLSTVDGNPEPVVMPPADEGTFIFTENGEILQDGAVVTQIGIAEFEDLTKLQKVGSNLYAAVDTVPDVSLNPGVMSGYLEGSNVNPIQEMVRMVEASRGFQTYQKVIQTMDELNDKAINQVGRAS